MDPSSNFFSGPSHQLPTFVKWLLHFPPPPLQFLLALPLSRPLNPQNLQIISRLKPPQGLQNIREFSQINRKFFHFTRKNGKYGKWGHTASAGPREKGEPAAQRADNATIHQTFRSAAPNQSRKYRTHSMTGLTKKKKTNAQPDKSTHFRLHKQQNSPENS